MSGELAYLGFAEAAELIRAKKLSPVEYATALLARIERHDGEYNAFIALTPERALKAARAAEAEITAGRWRGPFHGVPYALKDIIDVEGLATTAHSKILKGNIARRHAVVTERLEAAGGVLLGKLSTHEFAIGGPSFLRLASTICLTMANRSKVLRARRSIRVTVTMSPGARCLSILRSSRRSLCASVTFSR
jgi:aspartyl-tRNA(Asn)/glutamyl-tRNA(Gln) amidotransferase subunit A